MTTNPTELLRETLPSAQGTEPALDVESLKQLMDGFDPAALLPSLQEVFGTLASVCRFAVMAGPVIMLVLGLLYLFLAPKEANYYFGYRCYFGMGGVRAWRFTQRLAGLVLTAVGLVLTVVMFTVSGGFAGMEVTDMVWKAASCLFWQVGLALLSTLAINLTVAFFFDRKGEPRRGKKKKSKH